MSIVRKPNPNVCKACGWHWFKHGSKGQCPGMKPDPYHRAALRAAKDAAP